ncbi:MAG: homocysteine S-methyltransferase family protein, partial [Myxococcota bacterium]|nr:homocysteine S-methyltransferase family protein [Myxococcota bacterium]
MAAEYNGGGSGDRAARPDAAGALGRHGPGAAPLVLDGATGTELERRGLACEAPLWSARALAEAPDAVLDVHRRYVAAGV